MNEAVMILVVLISALAVLFVLVKFLRKLMHKELKPEQSLKTHSLTSRYFVLNTIYLFSFQGWFLLPQLFGRIGGYVLLFCLIGIPFILNRSRSFRKVDNKAFDEREELLILRSRSAAGFMVIIFCFITSLLSKQLLQYIPLVYLFLIPVYGYLISYNAAGWYYFRKNEKELKMEEEA